MVGMQLAVNPTVHPDKLAHAVSMYLNNQALKRVHNCRLVKMEGGKMKSIRLIAITISALSLLVLFPSLATAETTLAIYGGQIFPNNTDVKVRVNGVSGKVTERSDFDDSYTFGTRLTYWFTDPEFEADWFGMGLDVSYYRYKDGPFDIDVDVVPITGLIMLRYPGKFIQPYIGAGGGIFISWVDERVDLSSHGLGSEHFDDTRADFGFDARAGLALKFASISIFGEGRVTYFGPNYKDNKAEIEADDFATYHLLAGIAYHF
jgi:hypothetical protein